MSFFVRCTLSNRVGSARNLLIGRGRGRSRCRPAPLQLFSHRTVKGAKRKTTAPKKKTRAQRNVVNAGARRLIESPRCRRVSGRSLDLSVRPPPHSLGPRHIVFFLCVFFFEDRSRWVGRVPDGDEDSPSRRRRRGPKKSGGRSTVTRYGGRCSTLRSRGTDGRTKPIVPTITKRI